MPSTRTVVQLTLPVFELLGSPICRTEEASIYLLVHNIPKLIRNAMKPPFPEV